MSIALSVPVANTAITKEAPQPDQGEIDFYSSYRWCLNPHLSFEFASNKLLTEIDKLPTVREPWQAREVAANIFLLSSGLLNCADEFLRGPSLVLKNRSTSIPFNRLIFRLFGKLETLLHRGQPAVRSWRDVWQSAMVSFLSVYTNPPAGFTEALFDASTGLSAALKSELPQALKQSRLSVPSPFGRLDLCADDVSLLADRLIQRIPDRTEKILLLGLRTSGSYFGPIVLAILKSAGYSSADFLTIEPNKGAGEFERKRLRYFAEKKYLAIILDDPPSTGSALLSAARIAHESGFPNDRIGLAVPTMGTNQDWLSAFPNHRLLVQLKSSEWRKHELFGKAQIKERFRDFFNLTASDAVDIVEDEKVIRLNQSLQEQISEPRSTRLKKVYAFTISRAGGKSFTGYLLAKSVGFGWLSYPAFISARELSAFVPRVYGLRDGILFMEWVDGSSAEDVAVDDVKRQRFLPECAAYVSARVNRLNLEASASARVDLGRRNNGIRVLGKALSRAYGTFVTDTLLRSSVETLLRQLDCPFPTLIDGNLQRSDWVFKNDRLLKVDYEHHGMGKSVLNVTDPVYDLADAILNFHLTPENERVLVREYVAQTQDYSAPQRLFIYKLMAGMWTMAQCQEQLFSIPRKAKAQQDIHHRFMAAWAFLTEQVARYCGELCNPPQTLRWKTSLVALDIDGVIDRRPFGFPCTSAAGIRAISLLQKSRHSVAINTARSVEEVKLYCEAYALHGGVAEYGSYVWDAVSSRGAVMVGPEALRQLDLVRNRLRSIPGVFLDERHFYSVKAFTYRERPRGFLSWLRHSIRFGDVGDGALQPLPSIMIRQILGELDADLLHFHQTDIDTVVTARDIDKGIGLIGLRDFVLNGEAETIAVGDNTADLAAFAVATKSFAPGNINCREKALALGCKVVSQKNQNGLLEISEIISASSAGQLVQQKGNLFSELLVAMDRHWFANFLAALITTAPFKIFLR